MKITLIKRAMCYILDKDVEKRRYIKGEENRRDNGKERKYK